MCCLAEFIVKWVLIIANCVFALAGLTIVGLGIFAQVQLSRINDVLPVNLNFLTISVIVIGCVVFIIAFFACCGAMRESKCMLYTYAVFMAILAGIKIYITVVVFRFLDNALQNVTRWLVDAFANNNLRPAYNAMEVLFQCCGTFGPSSYLATGQSIPPSCCWNGDSSNTCDLDNSYEGCATKVGNYFENFGEAIGVVLIVVIIIELVCMIFGLFLACQIRSKKYTA